MRYLSLTMALVNNAIADPELAIKENGTTKILHALDSSVTGARGWAKGSELTVPHGGRMYLGVKDRGDNESLDPHGWYIPSLVGGAIDFDVDLSTSGCNCNAALYLISMPGYDPNQHEAPSSGGDFYCDANNVGGVWCPEMDIMEANTYAWHTTPHHCDAPNGKHYSNCDRSGDGTAVYSLDKTAYGPGDEYKINTLKTFHVKQEFKEENDKVTAIVTTFTQGDQSYSFTEKDSYVESMTGALKDGMTVAISNWGEPDIDMSWLDGDTGCQGKCANSPELKISNIEYTVGTSPTPPSPGSGKWSCVSGDCFEMDSGTFESKESCQAGCAAPPKPKWAWGGACQSLKDGKCGDSCSECDWSWPIDGSASDKDADCRCKTEGPSPTPSKWEYGTACSSLHDGLCGNDCSECDWSWPSGSDW